MRADVPEPFLPRRIPQLQLHFLSIVHVHQAREEVYADGGIGHLGKGTVREVAQKGTLSHGGIPNQDDPELILEDGLHHVVLGAGIPRQ